MTWDRRTFLDELMAAGRAHDAREPDRLARWRNLEPETAAMLAVLVRATGRGGCWRSAPPTATRRSGWATRCRRRAARC